MARVVYDAAMSELWDVAVIGGGPAGMMAAGRAAERGAKVILLEKNLTLGKKLLITGGGRCNVVNAEFDTKKLLAKYGESGKYLASPFAEYGARNAIDFFESRGMKIKVEAEQRAFPVSDSARSVHETLIAYMKAHGVTVRTKAAVKGFTAKEGRIESVLLGNSEIRARSFILATGGKSRPDTGSTGEGFQWLTSIGHKVSTSDAALVPVSVYDAWVKRVAGVSLRAVKVSLFQDGKKQDSLEGKILFTHEGLSGPAILNLSASIGEMLQYGDVSLEIDLMPKSGYEKVDAELQRILKLHHTKKIKNSLKDILVASLVPVALELAKIDPEKACNAITRAERVALMKILKHLPLRAKGLLGLDKAIITSGGVTLDEVDTKTMRSRLYPNLYLVGDVLNIKRPSGGFSLQLCWTTGFIAGSAAAK